MADDAPAVIAGETIVAPPDEKPEEIVTRDDNETEEKPEEPKPEEPKAEEKPEEKPEGEEEASEEGDKKRVPGSQRLKRRLALIEADYSAALNEVAELKQRVAQSTPNPEGKPGVDRPPTEADFPNDYFAYERAANSWHTRQAVREELERARAPERQRAQLEQQRERLELYHEYADEVRERVPDFDKVIASAKDVNVKPEVVQELLASDKSALLQYHLAKNPEKLRELNGMTGRELAKEIGRLEGRVHLPQPKKATEATPPPTPVRGGAATITRPEDADDMETYIKLRKAQGAFK